MTAITQYILPYGAFEQHNNEDFGVYERDFYPVNIANYKSENVTIANSIRLNLDDGIMLTTPNNEVVRIGIEDNSEFFKVFANMPKEEDFPKDITEVRFLFGVLKVRYFPHEFSDHKAAIIYVPAVNYSFTLTKAYFTMFVDFCKLVHSSRMYRHYRNKICKFK